jgi:hypothetical protein
MPDLIDGHERKPNEELPLKRFIAEKRLIGNPA